MVSIRLSICRKQKPTKAVPPLCPACLRKVEKHSFPVCCGNYLTRSFSEHSQRIVKDRTRGVLRTVRRHAVDPWQLAYHREHFDLIS